MKALRKLVGVVVLLLALIFAITAIAALAQKFGQTPLIPQLADSALGLNSGEWVHIVLAGATTVLWLISALSLLRGTHKAFLPYIIGLAATAALWWLVCQHLKYGGSFTVTGREHEIGIGAGLLVLGVLVWLTDRRTTAE